MIVTLRRSAHILSHSTHHIGYEIVGATHFILAAQTIHIAIATLALGYAAFAAPNAYEAGTELQGLPCGQQARSGGHLQPVQVESHSRIDTKLLGTSTAVAVTHHAGQIMFLWSRDAATEERPTGISLAGIASSAWITSTDVLRSLIFGIGAALTYGDHNLAQGIT